MMGISPLLVPTYDVWRLLVAVRLSPNVYDKVRARGLSSDSLPLWVSEKVELVFLASVPSSMASGSLPFQSFPYI